MHNLDTGSLAIGQIERSKSLSTDAWQADSTVADHVVSSEERHIEAGHFIAETEVDIGNDCFVG
jgi:hypothetical protein